MINPTSALIQKFAIQEASRLGPDTRAGHLIAHSACLFRDFLPPNARRRRDRRVSRDVEGAKMIVKYAEASLQRVLRGGSLLEPERLQALGQTLQRLGTWLLRQGLVTDGEALALERLGWVAAQDMIRAQKLTDTVVEYLEHRGREPPGDRFEDEFTVSAVAADSISLRRQYDGKIYGPLTLPPAIARRFVLGWTMAAMLGVPDIGDPGLVCVWDIYPTLPGGAESRGFARPRP